MGKVTEENTAVDRKRIATAAGQGDYLFRPAGRGCACCCWGSDWVRWGIVSHSFLSRYSDESAYLQPESIPLASLTVRCGNQLDNSALRNQRELLVRFEIKGVSHGFGDG
ncbi:MAG: hypothetical protein D3909_14125 [Candidatus Electrothrix sp. ATG1]|nr:hypothetical protein [Candidatus Electrothrix sp. ATG1]